MDGALALAAGAAVRSHAFRRHVARVPRPERRSGVRAGGGVCRRHGRARGGALEAAGVRRAGGGARAGVDLAKRGGGRRDGGRGRRSRRAGAGGRRGRRGEHGGGAGGRRRRLRAAPARGEGRVRRVCVVAESRTVGIDTR
ncbi:hypothetical protein FGB62_119g01 [Gracilaria domingensis]|nr:hypothetical protein FGB62_119g01 [Gracilaria domingensis]